MACSAEESCRADAQSGWQATVGEVEFPRGASQGGANWYALRLKLRVDALPNVSSDLQGVGIVSASIGAGAAAQIELRRSADLGRSSITWRTLELVSGATSGVVLEDWFEIEFANFLQIRSVRPGHVPITLKVDTPAPRWLRSVQVVPGASIVETHFGPPKTKMEVGLSSGKLRVGEPFLLTVSLKPSTLPSRDVRVRMVDRDQAVDWAVPLGATIEQLEREETVKFAGNPRLPGSHQPVLQITGMTGGSSSQVVAVCIAPGGCEQTGRPGNLAILLTALAAVLGLCAAILAVWRRLR